MDHLAERHPHGGVARPPPLARSQIGALGRGTISVMSLASAAPSWASPFARIAAPSGR